MNIFVYDVDSPTGFEVKALEVFLAESSDFRARTAFEIWHDDNGANYAI